MRALVISHGHPDLVKGGGEIAAYQLFRSLQDNGIDAYLLAATREDALQHGGTPFSMLRPHEILFHSQTQDFFTLSQASLRVVWHDFRQLLAQLRPDVIHFHHILHLGTQFVREAARYRTQAGKPVKLIYTLHEYLPICANDGQMVMYDSGELCTESGPTRCAFCLKTRPPRPRTPEELFLRDRFIRASLALIDQFIAPSAFLRDTYARWGLEQPVALIDNGLPPMSALPPRDLPPGQRRTRFAYLGQINRYKGLDVLLEAIGLLDPELREQTHLDVYGCGLSNQEASFRQRIEALCDRHRDQVDMHGSYDRDALPTLMSDVDTVVLPSIWWENSPLVLQEAKGLGRPVICSDLGGMKEKVRDGVDGLRFSRGSPGALARAMQRAADPDTWEELRQGITPPLSIQAMTEQVLTIYRGTEGA